MMPKSKGNAYFIACRKGAEEAAKELGVELIWDGPTDPDPAKQNEVVDTWITRGVDVIAVAVENREGISSVLRKARARGIKVITWDADAEPDARDFFVNQATPRGDRPDADGPRRADPGRQGRVRDHHRLADRRQHDRVAEAHRGPPRRRSIPTSRWPRCGPATTSRRRRSTRPTPILNAHPDVKLIMAICSPAVPGAAEAVKQSGRERREGHRPGPAQRQQAVRPRGDHRLRRPLEHDGPGLPDRPRRRTPSTTARSSPATRSSRPAGSARVEIAGRQRPARRAVHVHQGEHRPVRLLIRPAGTGTRSPRRGRGRGDRGPKP